MKFKKFTALFMASTLAASAFACNSFVSAAAPAYDSEAHKELLSYSAEDLSNTSADVKEYGHLYDEQATVNMQADITANGANGKVSNAVTYGAELIADPTADKGIVTDATTGWTNGYNASIVTGDNNYININTWTNAGNGAITNVNLKAGKKYLFTFKYRTGAPGAGVKIGNDLNETLTDLPTWTWTEFEFEFTASATGTVKVNFFNPIGGGNAYFDDVSLKEINPIVYGEELIADPTVSKGIVTDKTQGWINGNNASAIDVSGNTALRIDTWTNAGNGALTTVNLKSGSKYELTFRYRSGSTGAGVKVGNYLNETLNVDAAWAWKEFTFIIEPTAKGDVDVNFFNPIGSGSADFDDISLKEINPKVVYVDAEVPGAVTALLAETETEGQYIGLEMSYDNGYWIGFMDANGTKGTAIVENQEYANESLYLENKVSIAANTAGGKLTVYLDDVAILTDYEGVTIPVVAFLACEDVTYSVNAKVYTDKDNYDYLGDLNGDMTIDIRDLIRAKKITLGNAEAYNTHVAAFNEAGTIQATELTLIRKYLMGTITDFITESIDSVSVANFF